MTIQILVKVRWYLIRMEFNSIQWLFFISANNHDNFQSVFCPELLNARLVLNNFETTLMASCKQHWGLKRNVSRQVRYQAAYGGILNLAYTI